MSPTWAVARREFASFFQTSTGYVVVALFALIAGVSFSASLLLYAEWSQNPSQFGFSSVPDFEEMMLSPFLVFCGLLIMFLGPLITMRLMAEERHRGTIELLLTHPLRDRDIVFGKYLAALGMLAVMMLVVAVHLALVWFIVAVEPVVLAFGLLAFFLMGASFLALGLFISCVARTPIVAGALTFGLSMLLYMFGALGEDLPETNPAPETWPAAARDLLGVLWAMARQFVIELAPHLHAREMALGVFRPEDVAYYVLFTAFFLFLAFRVLEGRQWRA